LLLEITPRESRRKKEAAALQLDSIERLLKAKHTTSRLGEENEEGIRWFGVSSSTLNQLKNHFTSDPKNRKARRWNRQEKIMEHIPDGEEERESAAEEQEDRNLYFFHFCYFTNEICRQKITVRNRTLKHCCVFETSKEAAQEHDIQLLDAFLSLSKDVFYRQFLRFNFHLKENNTFDFTKLSDDLTKERNSKSK